LRYALTNADDGDVISFTGVTAGTTAIELASVLPDITRSIAIEGNGVTLTRAASWTTSPQYGGLLNIGGTAEVKISGMRFKDGRSTLYGGAIRTTGTLTLESCVFSGNQNTGYGGAIYSENNLTIRGCTFYGNTGGSCGAVYFSPPQRTLTLTGNLFYGNTAQRDPVADASFGNATVSASYNVVDVAFGRGTPQCGWEQGTGDRLVSALSISPMTFKLLSGSGAAGVIATLPPDYPATDFYGQSIGANAAAGAAQAAVSGGGYYLDVSVNDAAKGRAAITESPDSEGLYAGNVTLSATPESGYTLKHWLVNGAEAGNTNPWTYTASGHAAIKAVFFKNWDVISNADTTATGTLRHALTSAGEGDAITIQAGLGTITLNSALPQITKGLAIIGNGVTLTQNGFTPSGATSLLWCYSIAGVTISGIHFTGGRASVGGSIRTEGRTTLESCIFSDNQAINLNIGGGAIFNAGGILIVTGCTFYGNSANRGGAISYTNGGTVTLTGNIFYGNSAVEGGNVLYSYSSGGTVISGGYNVSDKASGTDAATGSGWAFTTGDTQISAGNPIDPTTFRPKAGSPGMTEIGIVPAGLAGFPSTDFYGATRTFPGGATGAVAFP
jgi:predicted outer membrane repeat protein